jgi:MFS family permease
VIAFGTTVARGNGVAAATLVVPVFAVTVIAARLLAAGVPDRFGAAPTLRVCVAAEGVGLAVLAVAHASVPALGALVVLSAGQALAVPALGLLALRGVPAERHGAAAGLFFSWFDAGVGLGGPAVGAVVGATSAPGAMALAGASVASVAVLVAPPALRTRPSGSRAPALDRRGAG